MKEEQLKVPMHASDTSYSYILIYLVTNDIDIQPFSATYHLLTTSIM